LHLINDLLFLYFYHNTGNIIVYPNKNYLTSNINISIALRKFICNSSLENMSIFIIEQEETLLEIFIEKLKRKKKK